MKEQELRHIMVDDIRGNVNDFHTLIRDGIEALKFFRDSSNKDLSDVYLYMDNDLGSNEIEGYKILDEIFATRDFNHYPAFVYLISSNTPAVMYMQQTLTHYNYKKLNYRTWRK